MPRFTACTVISHNRCAHARVLAASIREHHPDVELQALVLDPLPDEDGDGEPFARLTAGQIGIDDDEMSRLSLMYEPQELAGSLLPYLISWVLATTGGPVLALDSDIRVYGDLEPLADAAVRAAVVLSPHEVEVPAGGPSSAESQFLVAGAFHSGYVGVAPGAEDFLRWWGRRTARHCLVDPAAGLFVEQRWLSLAPGLFDVGVCRDPGANVTGWRLAGHDVDAARSTFMGVPLRFFHFCGGFDPHRPDRLTAMAELQWPALADRPGAALLCRAYAGELLAAGYDHEMARPYAYASLPDGRPLDQFMRRAYRDGVLGAEAGHAEEPPGAFDGSGERFLRWLAAPAPGDGLSRYHRTLWSRRLDLQVAFPAAGHDPARHFERWLLAQPEHLRIAELVPSA